MARVGVLGALGRVDNTCQQRVRGNRRQICGGAAPGTHGAWASEGPPGARAVEWTTRANNGSEEIAARFFGDVAAASRMGTEGPWVAGVG